MEKGKQVKVFFKNGFIAEGQVEEWSDTKAVLKTVNSQDQLIIYNVSENVVMVRIFAPAEQSIKQPPAPKLTKEPVRASTDLAVRFKTLADAREVQLKEHQQNIKRHVQQSFIPPNIKSNYVFPSFTQPGSNNSPSTQIIRGNDRNSPQLPRMPRKTS